MDANRKRMVRSLVIHLATGILVLWGVFFVNATINNIPLGPRTVLMPTLVGSVSGYLIYRSKRKIIEANINLESIVAQRTMDLKVANDLLNEKIAELDKVKKSPAPKAKRKK